MEALPKQSRLDILKKELEGWKHGVYTLEVRIRVAQHLKNKEIETQAQKDLETQFQAIDFLEKEITKVQGESEEATQS